MIQQTWQAALLSIQQQEWRHNRLKVQVKVVTMTGQPQWTILQMDPLQANLIHYLVKVGQLVDHLQEIQADLLLVWIWMETECPLHRQVDLIWDRDQTMDMDQTTWPTCNLIWTMQEHIKAQKDLQ